MKTVLNKTLLTVAAGLLVLPFAAIALLAGERALAVAAEGADGRWLVVALAIGGVLVGSWHGLSKHPVL
ncbi:MAG: hypothetical protein QOG00_3753 [Pyrinomonadaceae bacterium]|jgi:hypothetical protein|nr:hypothetical protein [Pyrinomonadaceae bacterium]MDQ1613822.1 hypothetical protein [Pyrinomonadaceae bacterium]MDX6270675.1 hypothetical protein [Acidobacteriota bacterium]